MQTKPFTKMYNLTTTVKIDKSDCHNTLIVSLNTTKSQRYLHFCIFLLAIKTWFIYNNPRTERWQSGNAADC